MKGYTVVVMLCLLNGTASAEAVSGLNGKADVSVGNLDGWDGKIVSGSAAGQLSADIGWQGDAMWSRIGEQDFYGLGGHVFWRNPQLALFGVKASGIQRDGVDSYQFGLEGEYYLSRITLSAEAGYANVKYDQPAPFIETDAKGTYLSAQARYYLTDNLALSVGGLRALDNGLGMVGVEYQTPVKGLSLFATAAKGDNDYDHAMAGIRYYFGKAKSLMSRHRTDDPENSTATNLWTLGTYGAEYNRKLLAYADGLDTSAAPAYGSVATTFGFELTAPSLFIEAPTIAPVPELPPIELIPMTETP